MSFQGYRGMWRLERILKNLREEKKKNTSSSSGVSDNASNFNCVPCYCLITAVPGRVFLLSGSRHLERCVFIIDSPALLFFQSTTFFVHKIREWWKKQANNFPEHKMMSSNSMFCLTLRPNCKLMYKESLTPVFVKYKTSSRTSGVRPTTKWASAFRCISSLYGNLCNTCFSLSPDLILVCVIYLLWCTKTILWLLVMMMLQISSQSFE